MKDWSASREERLAALLGIVLGFPFERVASERLWNLARAENFDQALFHFLDRDGGGLPGFRGDLGRRALHELPRALHRGRRWWSVQVDDNGGGDPDAVRSSAAQSRSFGLSSLDADAARVGGRLRIAAAPALGGVRLEVAVPVGAVTG